MAMAFTFRVLENGARNYTLQVNAVDASATTVATSNGSSNGIVAANGYAGVTTHFKIRRILYNTVNSIARVQWHATSNVDLVFLNGFGDFNMTDKFGMSPQGFFDDGGAGVTGDIDITSVATSTVAAGNNATSAFSLVFFCIKGA